MNDPYKTLGVVPGASEDEIKHAYRRLSRKYHPDSNIGKSEAEQKAAEEKFKEIQRAYKAIMSGEAQRDFGQNPYGQNPYGQNPFGSGSSYYGHGDYYGGGSSAGAGTDKDTAYYQAAANFIRNRMYMEALRTLSDIELRNGRWYYFSAMANAGLGNTEAAQYDINKARELEPYNNEYRMFANRMEMGDSGWYTEVGKRYGAPDMGGASFCLKLCLINIICNSCCGPSIFCHI